MKTNCPECTREFKDTFETCPHCDHSPEETFQTGAAVVFLPFLLAFLFLPLWILNQDGAADPQAGFPDDLIWLILLAGMMPMLLLGVALWWSEE
jgi:hypothetical protein